jgi:(p)ppGpp synthase/HD superfamily hydrolase
MAMAYAAVKHAAQERKDGFGTPYIGHPVAVSILVWQYLEPAGSHDADVPEDLAIAGLLHDVAEDAGGQQALDEISALFGPRVAAVVDHCSDAKPEPGGAKAEWRGRKESHIDRVRALADPTSPSYDPGACLVIGCDKLHNLTETAADFRAQGESALDSTRFKGGPQGIRWYYRALREALAPALPPALLARIDEQLLLLDA